MARVRISFVGYSSKHDEWIQVGGGRLRRLEAGPPITSDLGDVFYVMSEVTDVRQRAGRREYLTAWEGYSDSTWEPRSSFVGCDARRKLDAFLLRARSGHGVVW